MLVQLFLLIFFLFLIFKLCKRIIKNAALLNRLKQEPDFYPHTSYLFGTLWELWRMDKLGYKGVGAAKKLFKYFMCYPFSETGVGLSWGGNLLFPLPIIVATRTEILKAVLSTKQRVDKGLVYYIIDILGKGLITSDKALWAKHRKILNPTFHQGMLQHFVPVMSQQGQKLVSILAQRTGNGPTVISNFTELTSERIMAMLMETIMGAEEKDLDPHFRERAETFDNMQVTRAQNPIKLIKTIYQLTKEGQIYYQEMNYLSNESRRLILKRMQQLKEDENQNYSGRKLVLIDALLKEHFKDPKEMTLQHIVDEVITFLAAGWDTTTWTTSFTLQMVGSYPSIQEKIHQEIDSKLDGVTDDHLLTLEDISKLKYLECVINETLRYIPLVLVHLRHLYEDLEVEIDGKIRTFPAGTDVVIDAELVHRNPRYWKDPNRFIPERFLPENSVGRDPLSFIPFSYGPRNCIGKTFAMCEEKIILAQIFRKFKVTAVDPLDKIVMNESGIARRTETPLKFIFEPR